MARKLKKSKISICVFCEGESEQAYTDFLKSKFQDVAVFKRPSSTGLFDDADNRFKKFGFSLMWKKKIFPTGPNVWKLSSV